MRGLVSGLVGWFKGKKTVLGGVLVMTAAVAGVWYGKLDPVSGLTVLGVGLSISGFGAKANRHQAEILAALQGLGQAGADSRAGKPIGEDLQAVTGTLAPAAIGEAVQLGGASLHISAATADELGKVASKVLYPQVTFTQDMTPSDPASTQNFPATLKSFISMESGK